MKIVNEASGINWTDYFMGLAFAIAQKSPDPSTKHGTVLVDNHRHIIGTGYNGLLRGVDNSKFPFSRPDKYKFFRHSERNAIANCTINLWSIPEGGIAYVTGKCCNECLQELWQNNIKTVYMAKRQGTKLENEETQKDFDLIIRETKMKVFFVDINIDWLKEIFSLPIVT